MTNRYKRNLNTKLIQQGPARLCDAELMTILIQPQPMTSKEVHQNRLLLESYGCLRSLFRSPLHQFTHRSHLDEKHYAQLQAAREINHRISLESLKRSHTLSSPSLTKQFLADRFSDLHQEVFSLILLDNQQRLIDLYELTRGTINKALVHPREVVKIALDHSATSLMLVHNHPSGCSQASPEDKALTKRLKDILSMMDIQVLDHFIIGDQEITSFAEKGWI